MIKPSRFNQMPLSWHGLNGWEIYIHHLDLTIDLRSCPNERWLVLFILPAKDIVYLIFIRLVDVQAFWIISTEVQQQKVHVSTFEKDQ